MSPLLGLLAGCWSPAPEDASAPARVHPDIVLITLDTTRADRLGAYGYADAVTPNLDALAAAGTRFERAYSPIPLTIPAHASLFTGQYPPTHGLRSNGSGALSAEATTLAETLQKAGFDTAASVGAFVTQRQWGFDQGFNAYFDDISERGAFWGSERPANEVVDDIVAWREGRAGDAPVFAWVHLFDPHFPYLAPREIHARFKGRPYDAEIAFVDEQIGRVVAAFASRPTLFVVVADHGESLGEHGEETHGLYVYDATQRVPWIMSGPGIEPSVHAAPVSLVDVAPTVLASVGLPALPLAEGRDVRASAAPSPVYMETYQLSQRFGLAPHVAVVADDFKLIDLPTPELYAAGSPETEDLAAAEPGRVASLQTAVRGLGFSAPTGRSGVPVADVQDDLAALGYVAGDPAVNPANLPDPKGAQELVRRAQALDRLVYAGDAAALEAEVTALVAAYPTVSEFRTRLASTLADRGDHQGALVVLQDAPVADHAILHATGAALMRLKRHREAADLFLRLSRELPHLPRPRAQVVEALASSGDLTGAIAQGERLLAAYPDDDALAGVLGMVVLQTGDAPRAMPLLERGARSQRPARDLHVTLAAAASGAGETDASFQHLRAELEVWPGNHRARKILVLQLAREGRWEEVLEVASSPVASKELEMIYWVAQSAFNLEKFDVCDEAIQRGQAIDPKSPELMVLEANRAAQAGDMERGKALHERAKAEALARQAAAPAPVAPRR